MDGAIQFEGPETTQTSQDHGQDHSQVHSDNERGENETEQEEQSCTKKSEMIANDRNTRKTNK